MCRLRSIWLVFSGHERKGAPMAEVPFEAAYRAWWGNLTEDERQHVIRMVNADRMDARLRELLHSKGSPIGTSTTVQQFGDDPIMAQIPSSLRKFVESL